MTIQRDLVKKLILDNKPLSIDEKEQFLRWFELKDMEPDIDTLEKRNFVVDTVNTNMQPVVAEHFGTLSTDVDGRIGVSGAIRAMLIYGDYLYVTGLLSRAGNVTVQKIARFNLKTGIWDSVGSAGILSVQTAICLIGDDIYVVGSYETHPDAYYYCPIRKLDVSTGTWSIIGSAAIENVSGVARELSSLATDGTNLYVGGAKINNINGTAINSKVAVWNGSVWAAAGAVLGAEVEKCAALDYFDGKLYGGFDTSVFGTADGLKVLSGGTWSNVVPTLTASVSPLTHTTSNLVFGHRGDVYIYTAANGSSLIGETNGTLYSAYAYLENLYIGGRFSDVAGMDAKGVAKWSGGTWAQLEEGIYNTGSTVYGDCFSITGGSSYTFFGGQFDLINNKAAGNIFGWYTTFQAVAEYLESAGGAAFDAAAAIHNVTAGTISDSDEFGFWEDSA